MVFIENNNGNGAPVWMTAENIQALHAFTTRHGGVSAGAYETLNLGQNRGDDPVRVRENYDIICRALGIPPDIIVCSSQVHGANIRSVTTGDTGRLFFGGQDEADGLITAQTGVALAVFTADCVPILLHDPVRGAIGAVHAGWRGTAANIAGAAIGKMEKEFGCEPANIRAAVGPCISKCCFETGAEVAEAMRCVLGDEAENCVESRTDKYMVDLKEANRRLLIMAGVKDICVSYECTSCLCGKYWSHRKTGGIRGSQAAIITLKETSAL